MIVKNIFGCIVLLLLTGTIAFAATDAQISLIPRNPEPGASVLMTLTSYSIDIDNALITWRVAGQEVLQGYGEKRLSIPVGGAGQITPVTARAEGDGGDFAEVTINIVPQSVSLLYETPESYVPLFYEGRSLPGEGARVKFVAVGNILEKNSLIAPEKLTYNWYLNGEFQETVSGRGKQVAYIALDILSKKNNIKVITRASGGSTAEKTITIYPQPVLPLFYTYDEVFGTNYNRLLVRRLETTKGVILAFEPLYLSRNGDLIDYTQIDWALDGLPVTPFGGKRLLLDPKKDSYGSNHLTVSVSNSKRRLQKAEANLDIIFDTR